MTEVADIQGQALRSQRDRFVAFAFAAADLLFEVDESGRITYGAGASQRIHGQPADKFVGTLFLDLLSPRERPIAVALLQSIGRGGRFVPLTVRLAKEGAPTVLLGGCRLPNRPDATFLSLSVAPPGGDPADDGDSLLDRDSFAAIAAKRLLDPSDSNLGLTLVAVDELEALQSRLSKEAGDGLNAAIERYLQGAAPRVEAAGRVADGRYGLIHQGSVDEARLREGVETLSKAMDPSGLGVKVRASSLKLDSAGLNGSDAARALVYCVNQFADSFDADLSINSLREGLDKLLNETVARVTDFRSTVSAGTFVMVYQPIVDLLGRGVHHLEALARFPEGGSPASTVAFAEAVRLIVDFDLAVVERVIRALLDGGAGQAPIAVNLSGRSLESRFFQNGLTQLLVPHRKLSPLLMFEITESAVIGNVEEANAIMQSLRKAGFRVCLDDFGAGANSFHYLRNFDVDYVKIDGAFGREALARPRDRALLHSVVSFCRDNGVGTIAEMVETEEQAQAYREIGISHGQGYLFGKPTANAGWYRAAPPSRLAAVAGSR